MPHTRYTTLISASNLNERLNAAPSSVLVFDCRFDLANPATGEADYATGHLRGAHYLHLDRDLSGAKTGRNGRHPLPGRATLAATLAAHGLDQGQQVVAYDAHGGSWAARLWWLLRWLGHDAVAVLDGGLQAWLDAGLPLSRETPSGAVSPGTAGVAVSGAPGASATSGVTGTAGDASVSDVSGAPDASATSDATASGAPGTSGVSETAGCASVSDVSDAPGATATPGANATSAPRGSFVARAPLQTTVDVAAVERNLATREFVVIDARAADRYRGENETVDPVGGHIPGALNRFFRDNLTSEGRFKPAHALREAFGALLPGIVPGCVVLQCGSGVTACHNALALEIAGLHGAALYPGSWSEWCADPARPVATGAQP